MKIEIIKTFISGPPRFQGLIVALATLLMCSLVSYIYWAHGPISDLLPASRKAIFVDGQFWRLFSSILTHSNLQHLLSNSYMLGILVYFVYGYFGSLAFPFFAFLGAAITNSIAISTYSPEMRLVGASGLVYFLAGFWLCLFILIERQRRMGSRILRATGVGLGILFPTSFEPQISYRTHAIGFGVGILFGALYFWIKKSTLRKAEVLQTVDAEEGDNNELIQ